MGRIVAKDLCVRYPVMNTNATAINKLADGNHRDSWGRIVDGKPPHVIALDGVSLELKPGASVGILGRNGSGKTTLLRTLCGIIIPNSGTLDVSGIPSGIFNLRQGLRMESTGRRNIMLRGLTLGKTIAEIKAKQADIEEFSGLSDYLDLPVSTYSSGMVMRLIFAVVVAFDPDIMLLDEWIGTADDTFKARAIGRMKEFVMRDRIFILASHNTALLNQTCDTAIIMHGGKIVEMGSVSKMVKEYKRLTTKGS